MTLIYSDGYFRTGSNFLYNSLQLAYPEATITSNDPVTHYGIGLVKDLTIYSGIAISLRDPVHTLGSIFSFFKIKYDSERKIQEVKNLKGYLKDMQDNKENIFICKFDEMSDDINAVLNKFYERFPQVGQPIQINDSDIINSIISSGATHAVPGFNTQDLTELYSTIRADFATELEEMYAIYNEIVA